MNNKSNFSQNKKVSIIVPCRNESKYIDIFLTSIVNIDYPLENIEILLIDGMSDDGTRDKIDVFRKKYDFIRLLDNPKKIVPTAMNIGIKEAKGDIIMRLDAHAIYPSDYVSKLVHYSEKLNADNVGAFWETLPANNSMVAKSIAISLSSPFGVGNAEYRIQSNKDKEYFETDTVPFGCYRKEVFEKIGLYDEDLIRNQDNELNERLKKMGGRMFIIPSLIVKYFARENYKKLFDMFFQYGYFGPLVDLKLRKPTRLRRYIPAIFVLSLSVPVVLSFVFPPLVLLSILSIGLYALTNMFFSFKESLKAKNLLLTPFIFIANFTSHIAYGIGYIKGVLDFVILKKHNRSKIEIKLSR